MGETISLSFDCFSILIEFQNPFCDLPSYLFIHVTLKLAWERLSRLVLTDFDSDSSFKNPFFDFFRFLISFSFILKLAWERLSRLVLTAFRF